MGVTESFRVFVLEQLAGVDQIHARAMFGGVGLYAPFVFLATRTADTRYFKGEKPNRSAYESAGMKAFQPYADGPMSMSYYEVPAAVIEDPAELSAWARAVMRAEKGE